MPKDWSRLILSFSSLSILHECPHNWINKINKIEQPESLALTEGKVAHRLMQDHFSGKILRDDLKHIDYKFPIVEEVDFDERTKFEIEFGDKYLIMGFIDGLNLEEGRMLEIKSSSSPWSLGKFAKSAQRKIYGWARKDIKEALLVTGLRDPDKWATTLPKTALIEFTEQDYEEAVKYIEDGIKILESGEFTTDLVDGVCRNPRCYWGENCMFKEKY